MTLATKWNKVAPNRYFQSIHY